MGQPAIEPTPAGTNLAGKTVIITGGNSGLGYEAARQFLVLHASRVILAVRSLEKGQEAVSSLMADISVKEANPNAIIDVFQLDLDDYQSGVQFVDKVKREVKELDILLNNGGAKLVEYQESKSGHERVMQGEQSYVLTPCNGHADTNNAAKSTATPTCLSALSCCLSSGPRLLFEEHPLI